MDTIKKKHEPRLFFTDTHFSQQNGRPHTKIIKTIFATNSTLSIENRRKRVKIPKNRILYVSMSNIQYIHNTCILSVWFLLYSFLSFSTVVLVITTTRRRTQNFRKRNL